MADVISSAAIFTYEVHFASNIFIFVRMPSNEL